MVQDWGKVTHSLFWLLLVCCCPQHVQQNEGRWSLLCTCLHGMGSGQSSFSVWNGLNCLPAFSPENCFYVISGVRYPLETMLCVGGVWSCDFAVFRSCGQEVEIQRGALTLTSACSSWIQCSVLYWRITQPTSHWLCCTFCVAESWCDRLRWK